MYDERPLEFQIAILNPKDSAQERNAAILEAAKQASYRYTGAARAKMLPVINEKQDYRDFCENIPKGRIPLGYAMKDAKKISIPLKQASCLSLYFGNPMGRKKLFSNFLYAFSREGGQILVLPKGSGSVFTGNDGILSKSDNVSVISDVKNGAKELRQRLTEEIIARQTIRNRFCEEHGLVQSERESLIAASPTICQETAPCFVIIENYAECVLGADEATTKIWETILQIARYYNIYFLAGYEPGDTSKLYGNAMQTTFNPDNNTILFGGQMDKQTLISLDYNTSITAVLPQIGRGLMGYRGQIYSITMPCGEAQEEVNEEDASIF